MEQLEKIKAIPTHELINKYTKYRPLLEYLKGIHHINTLEQFSKVCELIGIDFEIIDDRPNNTPFTVLVDVKEITEEQFMILSNVKHWYMPTYIQINILKILPNPPQTGERENGKNGRI